MEFAKEIIAILSGLLILLCGSGGVLFFNLNKKLKSIQVDREASTEWKKLYDEKDDENKVITGRLNELYNHRRQQADEINQLNIKLAEKEVELVKKDVVIARKDAELANKDTELANKDTELANKDTELANKDVEITKLKYDRCFITGCKKREPKRNEINE